MNAKIEGSQLCVNITGIIESLSWEDKRSIIDSLSCDDEVIANVTAQLLDGCTEQGSYGGSIDGQADPSTPLNKAKREIALRAGEVAAKEIEDIRRTLLWEKACSESTSKWAWGMYHGTGDGTPPHVKYDDTLKYEVVLRKEIAV